MTKVLIHGFGMLALNALAIAVMALLPLEYWPHVVGVLLVALLLFGLWQWRDCAADTPRSEPAPPPLR
jgi:hypothetical protein